MSTWMTPFSILLKKILRALVMAKYLEVDTKTIYDLTKSNYNSCNCLTQLLSTLLFCSLTLIEREQLKLIKVFSILLFNSDTGRLTWNYKKHHGIHILTLSANFVTTCQ